MALKLEALQEELRKAQEAVEAQTKALQTAESELREADDGTDN